MPGITGVSRPGNGYGSYGMPQMPVYRGGRGTPTNPVNVLDTGMSTKPDLLDPRWQARWNPVHWPVTQAAMRYGGRVPTGARPRLQTPGPYGAGLGVTAATPQVGAIGIGPQGAISPGYGTTLANPWNPLFGRPGFSYTYVQPASRLGPTLKGAPGTGLTNVQAGTRARGFQPAGYGVEQYMPATYFDYTPPTDPYFGLKNEANSSTIPRTINIGVNGRDLVGTYQPHESIPADRFFKQGRSAGYWQDQSFGPDYRYLLAQQQVARYNLYNNIALSRPLGQNSYFLGYVTQPATASGIGNSGQGRPLGY